jgi:NAD(P)H-flavin reductase
MHNFEGRILELQMLSEGESGAWITCPTRYHPIPGQYLLAVESPLPKEPLTVALFSGGLTQLAFLALPPLPASWQPGVSLSLRGPLGKGFSLPASAAKVALLAAGGSCLRLLPLAYQALKQNAGVAIYADPPLPALPSALEAYPLSSASEALSWADYLAIDLPLHALPCLRRLLGLGASWSLSCQAEILITTPMPCGGLAECGVCAVPVRRGWKLACKDGPVFDLLTVDW